MKKLHLLLLLTIFTTALFTSCQKEALPEQDSVTISETITVEPDGEGFPDDLISADRDGVTYQYGFLNCTLGSYVYNLKVTNVATGATVHSSGGWFTGNQFRFMSLVPGTTYKITTTLTPPYVGQTGSITTRLKRYNTTTCFQEVRAIPSTQVKTIPACL